MSASEASPPTVAWLGTGLMGLPMTRRVLAAGLPVRAWNRTAARAEPLADDGAQVVASPVEASEGADLLVTMLLDADATAQAVTPAVLGALAPDAVWVQMGTIGVQGTDRLASLAADAGVAFVDAPVLGTRGPAEKGALVALVSGRPAAVEKAGPVLGAVSRRVVTAGDAPGQGSRLKLVANSWIFAATDGAAQALTLAQALGLDPQLFLDAVDGGPLDLPYVRAKAPMMLSGQYPASMALSAAHKDAGLIRDAGRAVGADVSVAEANLAHLQAALDAGHGDDDLAAVVTAHRPPTAG